MIKTSSITNPLYLGYGIQSYLQKKEGLDMIQTFLNHTSVPKKGFNPTFAVFRVVNSQSEVVAYITFRSKLVKRDSLSESSFSSVAVHSRVDFNVDTPFDKFHIIDFTDDNEGLANICSKVRDSITKIMSVQGLTK